MNKKTTTDDNYLYKLEREWRASQKRYSEKDLLEIFPEAKEIVPNKIEEFEAKKEYLLEIIREKLRIIKYAELDDFSRFFWREYVKIFDGKNLLVIKENIARLSRMISDKKVTGIISENNIESALQFPIEKLINQPLKKYGNKLKGSCPLHNEKTPSFYVYPESNSFYCFGCKQGGNNINLIRLLYNYSFKEAVKHINN